MSDVSRRAFNNDRRVDTGNALGLIPRGPYATLMDSDIDVETGKATFLWDVPTDEIGPRIYSFQPTLFPPTGRDSAYFNTSDVTPNVWNSLFYRSETNGAVKITKFDRL